MTQRALIILVSIETLARFRYPNPNEDDRNVFRQFMEAYFNRIWQTPTNGRTYALLLYDQYRNAMTHGFYARGFWEAQQEEYIIPRGRILTINIYMFYFDFVEAIKRYFDELDQNAELRRLVGYRVQTLLDEIQI